MAERHHQKPRLGAAGERDDPLHHAPRALAAAEQHEMAARGLAPAGRGQSTEQEEENGKRSEHGFRNSSCL